MKRKIAAAGVLSVAGLGLAACALTVDETDEQAEQVYGRTWVAEALAGQPAAAGVESIMILEADGRVSGNGGCNGYYGSVIVDGPAMTFGNLGSTGIAGPEPAMSQEDRLLEALDDTRGYRVEDGRLFLLDGAGATLVRFRLDDAG